MNRATLSTRIVVSILCATTLAEATQATERAQGSWQNHAGLRPIRVSSISGPILRVQEPTLGTYAFGDGSRAIALDVASGQELRFQWSADVSPDGGQIEAYRYGWDLTNPNDDDSWDVDWSLLATHTEPVSFSSGQYTLHIQVRDDLQQMVEGVFEIHVVPFTGERALLFVDDAMEADRFDEPRVDDLWLTSLETVAMQTGIEFIAERDIYDTIDNRSNPPPVDLLFQYAAVIWDVQAGPGGATLLNYRFRDPFVDRNVNVSTFNLLRSYLAAGGKLWISGFRPAHTLWPPERALRHEPDPVNVTNWDDPIEPHPGVDSVGTTSLLYQLGAEIFDCGASVQTARRTTEHFCLGVRAAKPGAPSLQVDPVHWPVAPTLGRINIEIYNMPEAMAQAVPPLAPPDGKVDVLYTYVSGVPYDEGAGSVYPATADRAPVFLISRSNSTDVHASGALSGFRLHWLMPTSHVDLLRYVLQEEFGSGPVPVLLQEFRIEQRGDQVQIQWQLSETSDEANFMLQARTAEREWVVPHDTRDARRFAATDDMGRAQRGEAVTYSLFYANAHAWVLLREQEFTAATATIATRLLNPYPNPANPSARIRYELATSQRVTVSIYSVDGQRVVTLVRGVLPQGAGSVLWNGTDDRGQAVASGLYVVQMTSDRHGETQKLLLVR